MACVSTDGTLTESGLKMFRVLNSGPVSPEEIAQRTGLPLFRVRGGLRDLIPAGFAILKGDKYQLTEKGTALLK